MLNYVLFKYGKNYQLAKSILDPLSDIVAWIQGLRSTELVGELLKNKHGFTDTKQIKSNSQVIKVHIDNALNLLDQALSSDSKVSYLPFYYAFSSLAKVIIITGGFRKELEMQRQHGITWSGIKTSARDLLSDQITLMPNGVMPLYYKTLIGRMWPTILDKKGAKTYSRIMYLRDIYPYILGVGHEYLNTYGKHNFLAPSDVQLHTDDAFPEQSYISVQIQTPSGKEIIRATEYKILRGLKQQDANIFHTRQAEPEQLLKEFPLHLIYNVSMFHEGDIISRVTITPRSRSTLILPSEFPTYLAFFHLSNVVRYDPERLYRLFDSRAISLLVSIKRYGTYYFLVDFWNYMNRGNYFLTSG